MERKKAGQARARGRSARPRLPVGVALVQSSTADLSNKTRESDAKGDESSHLSLLRFRDSRASGLSSRLALASATRRGEPTGAAGLPTTPSAVPTARAPCGPGPRGGVKCAKSENPKLRRVGGCRGSLTNQQYQRERTTEPQTPECGESYSRAERRKALREAPGGPGRGRGPERRGRGPSGQSAQRRRQGQRTQTTEERGAPAEARG